MSAVFVCTKFPSHRVQLQFNRVEARHELVASRSSPTGGEFCSGDADEIMNKAGCLSLQLNAVPA